jgi:hypothetical protein
VYLILFTEYAVHLVVIDVYSLIKTPRPILQLVLGVALELIVFREYCYHRNFENGLGQSQFMKLRLDMPFLSGQIS